METSGGIQASLGGRYATALFQLALESNQLAPVEQSLATLGETLKTVPDFKAMTTSPVLGREAAGRAIAAVAKSLKIDPLTTRFLGVLAQNRRLSQLGAVVRAFKTLASNHRGELSADVTSAHPLTADQLDALKKQLRTRMGREVAVTTHVDSAILGGLVVRIGSRMIDSSIRTRLNTLAHAMKG